MEICHGSDDGLLILSEVGLVLESKACTNIYTKEATKILKKDSK